MLHNSIGDNIIILASSSPRRQSLIKELGIPFKVTSIDVDEIYPDHLEGKDIAEYLSELKSNAYQPVIEKDQILITADTIVSIQNRILNKPTGPEQAREMLKLLSGKAHDVITGVTLSGPDKRITFSNITRVYFNELTNQEIDYYIDQYKPFDKAGAYGIQEWIGYVGIEKIEGSYFNVMGLPIHQLYRELERFLK